MDLRREKKQAIMRYAGYVAGTLGVGGLSALLSRGGMEAFAHLKKPSFSPPGWVFPVVWTILYILMGTAAWMIGKSEDADAAPALRLYRIQLIVNALWPLLFFRLSLRLLALLWLLLLIALIVLTIRRFYAIRPTAAFLLLPYLAWCLFAAYLNLGFYLLNS